MASFPFNSADYVIHQSTEPVDLKKRKLSWKLKLLEFRCLFYPVSSVQINFSGLQTKQELDFLLSEQKVY